MYKVVITGSIATGKSLVSNYLKELGYPLVDADVVSRVVVEPGQLGLKRLEENFGQEILQDDGSLDRAALAEIIFDNDDQREKVNQLLHPLIQEEMNRQLDELQDQGTTLAFIDIPLFYETKTPITHDEVWLVYVDQKTQLSRLMNRNSLNTDDAMSRIQSQTPIEKKKEFNNIVIDNQGTREATYQQVDQRLKYLKDTMEL